MYTFIKDSLTPIKRGFQNSITSTHLETQKLLRNLIIIICTFFVNATSFVYCESHASIEHYGGKFYGDY